MRSLPRSAAARSLLACLACLTGCDEKAKPNASVENPGAASAASAPAASAVPAATARASASALPENAGVSVDGLGEVPAWAPDKTTKHCALDPAIKPRLDALKKGDAAVGAGTANVAALVKELGADTCFLNRRALAQALNDGGFALYGAKKLDEANRHWRAALVVRPSLVLARYNLACGLALSGKADAAVNQIAELARAAGEGDASASNSLEKAKSDKDLESVRAQPAFQAALKASSGGLVGPRKEPETAAKAVALLPDDLRKAKDELGVTKTGTVVYKPAVTNFWTWRPDASTELLVATVVDDPAKLGKPKADLNQDWGAIAVYRRDAAGKPTLLTVRKTGESPPSVAAGKDGGVTYSFEQPCGALSGTLSWNGTSIDLKEKNCRDL